MPKSRVWRRLLGLSGVKIETIELAGRELVVRVALHRRQRQRCGICRPASLCPIVRLGHPLLESDGHTL